jgi:hypothetical protein
MEKVQFTPKNGVTMLIPAVAFKTYKAKHDAVAFLQANGSIHASLSTPGVEKAYNTIRRANRKIEKEGWYSARVTA